MLSFPSILPCISHFPVCPLIHSFPLLWFVWQWDWRNAFRGSCILAGLHLRLAHWRHWWEMKGGRVCLLPHHSVSGGISRSGYISSVSLWLPLWAIVPPTPLTSCCHWSLRCFSILCLSSQLFHYSYKKFPLLNFIYLKYLERYLFSWLTSF